MRSWSAVCLACAAMLSLAASAGMAATIATGDGLSLDVTASGAVTGVRMGDADLPVSGEGGFAVADFANQPELQNLIANPGFEDGATGWSLVGTQSIVEEGAHTGNRCALINVAGPDASSSSLGTQIPVKPNTKYRCELWVRRENAGVCGAYISERDAEGKLSGPQTQVGATIPKVDGVWHQLKWELRTQPTTTQLNIRADIYRSTGKLWIDDFFIAEMGGTVFQPVAGQLTGAGSTYQFKGSVESADLEVEATLAADADVIRVDGVVRDTTGQDRAVAVRFGLPIDADGWTWQAEPGEPEPVTEAKGPQRYTYDCRTGIGECSIYPFCSLSTADTGLAMALPLSQGPRVFILEHDQASRLLSVTFYFGLAADAGHNPSRAPFSFVIYRHNPAWGLRAAMERYYRLFAESFIKRPTFEGYLNYVGLEEYLPQTHELFVYRDARLPDASDFGEGYKFLWHLHGCYDFRMVPYDNPERPPDEVVMGLLDEMVQAEQEKPRGYVPTAETIKKICHGPNGEILYIGDTRYWRPQEGYNHTDQAGWGLNFRVNEDPDISPTAAERSRAALEKYSQDERRRPWDAMLTADAIEGYHANRAGGNYRREHFATTLPPLTFGKDNLRPAMPNTIWDLHHKAWWPLSGEHRVVIHGNANAYEQFFTMPYIDVPMLETDWDPKHPARYERFLRAVNYQKIWRYWRVLGNGEKDHASMMRHFARGLAYATYPALGPVHSSGVDLERYRAYYRQYVPAIEELSIAGWEPVPYARTDNEVVIERYGSFAAGELHFTLRNYDTEAAATAKVSIDRAALGIPVDAELLAVDVLPGVPCAETIDAAGWPIEVAPDNARAFWVGTREQLSRHGFRLAGRLLEKLDRLYHLDMTDDNRQALDAARRLADAGVAAGLNEALALARDLGQAADALFSGIEARGAGPVDLAKLDYRLRAALSFAPVATLSLDLRSPRLVEGGLRGAASSVSMQRGALAAAREMPALAVSVRSPWPGVAEACSVQAGPQGGWVAQLDIPSEPQRVLMPYLITATGNAGAAGEFTIALPVDVMVSDPLTAAAEPTRVFRGKSFRVNLRVGNALAERAVGILKLSPPAKMAVEPSEIALDVAAGSGQDCLVTVTLEPNARLGEQYVEYTIGGPDARIASTGRIALTVSDPVPHVRISRVPSPPTIDGKLDDRAWQAAPLVEDMALMRGGKPATEKTSVWVAYDDAGLYIAFRCHDSQMGKLKADHTERGAPLYQDDDVEVFLLPPGAARPYQFAINPLGTISDNFGDGAEWQAAAERGADAWTVEVFIPYAAVGAEGPPPAGASWAAQFGRQQKAKAEVSAWTPTAAFIDASNFGELVFE